MKAKTEILDVFVVIFDQITQSLTFSDIQESYLKGCWESLVLDSIAGIAAIRRSLNVKIELNANRKIVAGLELLEKTAGNLLQQLFDNLQGKIPLPVLLSCVLNQNTGNTIRDVSHTINKVILSLQMDIESYSNFVRIYRGDYNETLHQIVEGMKRPFLGRFSTCAVCNESLTGKGEMVVIFACGHSFHKRCVGEVCPICREGKEEVKKKVVVVMACDVVGEAKTVGRNRRCGSCRNEERKGETDADGKVETFQTKSERNRKRISVQNL